LFGLIYSTVRETFCAHGKGTQVFAHCLSKRVILLAQKRCASRRYLAGRLIFAPHFDFLNMENIPNARGKGYCLLYLLMGIFFFVALVLMLYYRNFIMEFPTK
jgi:hypothetical protein